MMSLEVSVEGAWPAPAGWKSLAACAAGALGQCVPELANPRLSTSLLFTSDAEVQALNRAWRGKDRPTNVLSFPMLERMDLLALAWDGPPELLGDIALALETCRDEAAQRQISLEHHAVHLVVHGLLHLAGHDHETGPGEAAAMEALEIKALAQMGIANPYCDAP